MEKASHPLAGKRIVVTRAAEQSRDLISCLEEMGAEVLLLPVVAFVPPNDWEPVDAALRNLAQFDWVLFTSQNAIGFFNRRCYELGLDCNLFQLSKPRVAVVGPATAEAAEQKGLRVDHIAKQNNGEALASELQAQSSLAEKTILLPRSDRADDRLPNALREAGAHVTDIVAYRTAVPESIHAEIIAQVRRVEVDAIVFASRSAFDNLSRIIGSAVELASISRRVAFAAIGPTTARALREAKARVAIEADEPSAASVAEALAKYYRRQPSAAGTA